MALLLQKASDLIICAEDRIMKYNAATNEQEILVLPQIVEEGNSKQGKSTRRNNKAIEIITACVSTDGMYFAVSSQTKQVVVYNHEFSMVKNFTLARTASKLRFSHRNDVLVADKTGDAYLYKLTDKMNIPVLILGHLSMLLDILITRCGKYIITCDRDEKIRVSHFPNSYNIVSYCLGHREFVINIEIIEDILISASGDGTIRFWSYLSGCEVHSITTEKYIKNKDVVNNFCREMDKKKCEVSCLPITNMQVFTSANILVAVSILHCDVLQIYHADIISKVSITTTLLQNIVCRSTLLSFNIRENLFLLLNDVMLLYHMNSGKFELEMCDGLQDFYVNNENVLQKLSANDDISILYKRKFDNVQEYLERKKLRLQIK